ncbi:MAG: nucleoid-associated protein, partial [Luteibaculum sp.]
STAQIKNASFAHFNKELEQCTAPNSIDLSDYDHEEILKNIFLKPFTQCYETYSFWHPVSMDQNSLYACSKELLSRDYFKQFAIQVQAKLVDSSKHPNIKSGDFFVLQCEDVLLKAQPTRAIALVKVESKSNFLDPSNHMDLKFKQGIGQQKLDKGLLILEQDEDFTVLLIDNASRETEYWKNDFAKIKLKNDEVNSTNQMISMAKTFISQQIPHEYEVEKSDQIDLLNKSAGYFKNHDNFKRDEFEQEVFGGDTAVVESFRNYESACRSEADIQPLEEFEISKKAVQKHGKVFKSVLKLDKNFHIYIHGDKSLIRKGVDESGKKYYQIFYEEEN